MGASALSNGAELGRVRPADDCAAHLSAGNRWISALSAGNNSDEGGSVAFPHSEPALTRLLLLHCILGLPAGEKIVTMTTSITDARYTSLHFTPGALLALSIDEPPETGWSVMPGYDEHIPIPPEQQPPRMDADETLPNLLHPSYPYGRPPTLNGKGGGQQTKGWARGGKSLLNTVGDGIDLRGGGSTAAGRGWMGSKWAGEEGWGELALGGFMERSAKKEVPPGMAGAKRPPSPPSPALRPSQAPQPRSEHLRNLYARQQQANPTPTADQFDAPVPNELYAEDGEPAGNESALTNTAVPEAMDDGQGHDHGQGSFRSDENNRGDDDDEDDDEDRSVD